MFKLLATIQTVELEYNDLSGSKSCDFCFAKIYKEFFTNSEQKDKIFTVKCKTLMV